MRTLGGNIFLTLPDISACFLSAFLCILHFSVFLDPTAIKGYHLSLISQHELVFTKLYCWITKSSLY